MTGDPQPFDLAPVPLQRQTIHLHHHRGGCLAIWAASKSLPHPCKEPPGSLYDAFLCQLLPHEQDDRDSYIGAVLTRNSPVLWL